MHIKVQKLYDDVILPEYAHEGDSGMDLRIYISDEWMNELNSKNSSKYFVYDKPSKHLILEKSSWCLVPTGLKMAIPEGYEGQIRPRSGLALKQGLTVLNSPGTLDASYRGSVGVILVNYSDESIVIEHNDKIAQLVICPVTKAKLILTVSLDETDRGDEGFGSTGVST